MSDDTNPAARVMGRVLHPRYGLGERLPESGPVAGVVYVRFYGDPCRRAVLACDLSPALPAPRRGLRIAARDGALVGGSP